MERFGLGCEWGERQARAQSFGGYLVVFLDSHLATQCWPRSSPPELLAEKMGSQRHKHGPRAAALAVPWRMPGDFKRDCSCQPRAFRCVSTLWQKRIPPNRGKSSGQYCFSECCRLCVSEGPGGAEHSGLPSLIRAPHSGAGKGPPGGTGPGF